MNTIWEVDGLRIEIPEKEVKKILDMYDPEDEDDCWKAAFAFLQLLNKCAGIAVRRANDSRDTDRDCDIQF